MFLTIVPIQYLMADLRPLILVLYNKYKEIPSLERILYSKYEIGISKDVHCREQENEQELARNNDR